VSGKQSPLGWSFRPYQTLYQPVPLTGIPTGEISTKGDYMYSDCFLTNDYDGMCCVTGCDSQVKLSFDVNGVIHCFVMDEVEAKDLFGCLNGALNYLSGEHNEVV